MWKVLKTAIYLFMIGVVVGVSSAFISVSNNNDKQDIVEVSRFQSTVPTTLFEGQATVIANFATTEILDEMAKPIVLAKTFTETRNVKGNSKARRQVECNTVDVGEVAIIHLNEIVISCDCVIPERATIKMPKLYSQVGANLEISPPEYKPEYGVKVKKSFFSRLFGIS